jgi:hypothetical protein
MLLIWLEAGGGMALCGLHRLADCGCTGLGMARPEETPDCAEGNDRQVP